MDKELHTSKMDIGFWKSCDEMDFCQLFVNIIRYLMIHQNWVPMLKVLQILCERNLYLAILDTSLHNRTRL